MAFTGEIFDSTFYFLSISLPLILLIIKISICTFALGHQRKNPKLADVGEKGAISSPKAVKFRMSGRDKKIRLVLLVTDAIQVIFCITIASLSLAKICFLIDNLRDFDIISALLKYSLSINELPMHALPTDLMDFLKVETFIMNSMTSRFAAKYGPSLQVILEFGKNKHYISTLLSFADVSKPDSDAKIFSEYIISMYNTLQELDIEYLGPNPLETKIGHFAKTLGNIDPSIIVFASESILTGRLTVILVLVFILFVVLLSFNFLCSTLLLLNKDTNKIHYCAFTTLTIIIEILFVVFLFVLLVLVNMQAYAENVINNCENTLAQIGEQHIKDASDKSFEFHLNTMQVEFMKIAEIYLTGGSEDRRTEIRERYRNAKSSLLYILYTFVLQEMKLTDMRFKTRTTKVNDSAKIGIAMDYNITEVPRDITYLPILPTNQRYALDKFNLDHVKILLKKMYDVTNKKYHDEIREELISLDKSKLKYIVMLANDISHDSQNFLSNSMDNFKELDRFF